MGTYERDAAEVKSILQQMLPLVQRIDRVLTEKLANLRSEDEARSHDAGKALYQVGNNHST
jgi:hypothetical protein